MHTRITAAGLVTALALLPALAQAQALGQMAADHQFTATLSGAQQVPEVNSSGAGDFVMTFNDALSAATFSLSVFGIETPTGAHLHCAPAGENGPIVVDLLAASQAVTNLPMGPGGTGVITNSAVVPPAVGALSLSNINGTTNGTSSTASSTCPVAINNIASLYSAARAGLIYVNVHTPSHPDGEIRAQLFPSGNSAATLPGFLGFPFAQQPSGSTQ